MEMTAKIIKTHPKLGILEDIPKNNRLKYVVDSERLTWYKMNKGRMVDYYPIFLRLWSIKSGVCYTRYSVYLNPKQCAEYLNRRSI